MNQPLYGLQVDYMNRHGHFMVLSQPGGMQQGDLSAFQVNMLLLNRIPRLLDMQIEAKDGDVRLLYPITGKRMITHWLRMEKLTLNQYYTLLLNIVDILSDSKTYMLVPERYVLKEDFIYCGGGLQDIYLTYVPKEHLEGKGSVCADLQELASRWIHRVTELQGSGFQELMRYFQEESFHLPELKQLLLKQISLLGSEPALSDVHIPQPANRKMDMFGFEEDRKDTGFMRESDYKSNKDSFASQEMAAASSIMEPPFLRSETGSDESATAKSLAEIRKKRLYLLLFTVLAWSLIWKWYADGPLDDRMLYLCSGLTLLCGAVAFVFLRKWKSIGVKTEEVIAEQNITPEMGMKKKHDDPVDDKQSGDEFFSRIGLAPYTTEQAEPSLMDNGSKEADGVFSFDMRTTVLRSPDATVLLQRPAVQRSNAPYLEFRKNGVLERLQIHKNQFLIGRAEGEADWVCDDAEVSRLHAEILKEQEGCAIRDLGSRNGTFVNGERLVPYQMHDLKEGDIVKIVTTELTYTMGS